MTAPTNEQIERGASALLSLWLKAIDEDGSLTFQQLAETALRTLHPEALALDAMHNAKDHLSPHRRDQQ